MALFKALKDKIKESLLSILPIACIVLILYITPLVSLSGRELTVFLLCTVFLIIGIALFNLGADLAMMPMGMHIGSGLTKSRKLHLLLSISFAMGLFITVAEPDLSVLASQVSGVINSFALVAVVGIGVGCFLLLAVLKIVMKKELAPILIFFYMVIFASAALLIQNGKGSLLSLSFDSGGVTTGPITVPFIMALGVGIAQSVGGKRSEENSFGLVALCSVGPVLAMLVLSLFSKGEMVYEAESYSLETDSLSAVSNLILQQASDVALAIALVLAIFMIINLVWLKLPWQRLRQILIGIVYAFFGLVIFLSAATAGYMPIGYKIGSDLAAGGPGVILPLTFILGMTTVLAEPAIHVLNHQVEDITGGSVSRTQMMVALSLGVGISVCLSALRVVLRFSILYYLIPGYIISLGLSFFVPGLYTAIAFDSGGVASGPLTSTFVLPLIIGVCSTLNGSEGILDYAFGMVAMVAMTPLIAIQILGFGAIFKKGVRDRAAMNRIRKGGDDQIIYFDWGQE